MLAQHLFFLLTISYSLSLSLSLSFKSECQKESYQFSGDWLNPFFGTTRNRTRFCSVKTLTITFSLCTDKNRYLQHMERIIFKCSFEPQAKHYFQGIRTHAKKMYVFRGLYVHPRITSYIFPSTKRLFQISFVKRCTVT